MKSVSYHKMKSVAAAALIASVAVVAAACLNAGKASGDPSMTHVLTFTYIGGHDAPELNSYGEAAKWTTWAFTSVKDSPGLRREGIKTVWYTNPTHVAPGEPTKLYTEDESMFLHDCAGNRITINKSGRQQRFLTEPSSGTLSSRWRAAAAAHPFDAYFLDNTGSLHSLSAQPCKYDPDSYAQATLELIRSLGYPVIYNELMDFRMSGRQPVGLARQTLFDQASNVVGGMAEGCYVTYQNFGPIVTGARWNLTEDTQIKMAQDGKEFICLSRSKGKMDASQAIDLRQYTYASFMLTYDPRTSVLAEPFYTSPSGFWMTPEVALVPSDPLVGEPSDVESLRLSTGAYGREFAHCSVGGTSVGPCAAVVNPDASRSVGFPYSKYHHTLTMNGSGVSDGGTISTSGPPPPSSIPPGTGVVVFQ